MAITPVAERRVLHYADKGNDVLAYQRALVKTLKALHLVPVTRSTGQFGKGTLADTLRLQKAEGIAQSGRVGTLTWTAIDPKLDAYGKLLLALPTPPVASPGQRVAHEARVLAVLAPRHYTQLRPYAPTTAAFVKDGDDCSGSSELAYKNAGVQDPNASSYNGYANSWTQLTKGVKVAPSQTTIGALTFYGGGEHVTIELGDGTVFSHGSQGGPRILPRGYRTDYYETRKYL